MKVEINTKERTVFVAANDIAKDTATIDKWIEALKVSRTWLRKELNSIEARPEGTEPLSDAKVDALKANFRRTHGQTT